MPGVGQDAGVRIFHIATTADWLRAQETGSYTTSTYGASLADVGYLHAAHGEQVNGVLARYYADVDEPLVILEIESDLLASPWREDEVGEENFPHIYGPLNIPAVVSTRELPGAGQESVWDYPRPPRLEPSGEVVEIRLGGRVIARTDRALRVLETSHPPVYYLPAEAFSEGALRPGEGTTYCEFKGEATYFDLVTPGRTAPRAGWTYPAPTAGFEALLGHVAVMPAAMDECTVDGEVVVAQEGGFYGGWITARVVGPFKGGPGTAGW
jgi:uncharacterized protein (DUF427 family)